MIYKTGSVVSFVARNLPEAWFLALHAIWEHGEDYVIGHGSFEGQVRREINGLLTFTVQYPCEEPRVEPGGPVTQEYVEEDYAPYILTTEKGKEKEQYTYGSRLMPYFERMADMHRKVIEKSIEDLRVCPKMSTNQAVTEIAQPSDSLLDDPPCMRLVQTRLVTGEIERKLDLVTFFRSWDVYAGLPANLAALTYYLEALCTQIGYGVRPGKLLGVSSGAHVYDMYFDQVRQRLNAVNREPDVWGQPLDETTIGHAGQSVLDSRYGSHK